ncbi:VCBS domain-containing protein [Liquorilactobacillus satsumensis]|uniref:VCBS domain-containing protein n=1 Tax=Liquorilactobacillus satsumensis TaxID=259059 RepID=UPI0039E84939
MEITLNRIAYSFAADGTTQAVSVGLNGSQDNNAVSASIQLTAEDVTDGKTLDDLTKKDFQALAKAKLAKFTVVQAS